jgi:arsenate reductase
VNEFIDQAFDIVVTVCDSAKESCPIFTGTVKNRYHHSFEDPWGAAGTEEQQLQKYREVRDDIKTWFRKFYDEKLRQKI